MSNTGRFYLFSVNGAVSVEGTLLRVTRIVCKCISCQSPLTATVGCGLIDLDGAAVLTCPHCNNRQAISRARLEELRPRADSIASDEIAVDNAIPVT